MAFEWEGMRGKNFLSLLLFECLFLTLSSSSAPRAEPEQNIRTHSFSLTLIGVLVSKDTSASIAILKNEEKGKLILLKSGENILGLKLALVLENGIVLEKEGTTYRIFVGKSLIFGGEEKAKKNPNRVVEKMPADNSLKSSHPAHLGQGLKKMEFVRSDVERRVQREWPLILKETRFVPNYVNGKIKGFRITSLPDKGIIAETGILKNDVVREVNGTELNDVATLFRLYSELKNENQCEVAIERNGKPFRILFVLK